MQLNCRKSKIRNWLCNNSRIIIFFLLFSAPHYAQVSLTEISVEDSAVFVNNLDVYDWYYHISRADFFSNLVVASKYSYHSKMQELTNKKRWKDLHDAAFIVENRFNPTTSFFMRLSLNSLQDQLSTLNYDREQSGATLAGRWRLLQNVTLQPEVGYRWEKRSRFYESGPYTAFLLSAPEISIFNSEHFLYSWLEQSKYEQRNNAMAQVNYSYVQEFAGSNKDSLVLYYDFLQRDNYTGELDLKIVESLNKSSKGFENYFIYLMNEHAQFNLRSRLNLDEIGIENIQNSRVAARRGHDDFQFTNRLQFLWNHEHYQNLVEIHFGESTIEYSLPDSIPGLPFSRRFAGVGYDVTKKNTRIVARSKLKLGKSDSLRFNFELSKLEYDNTNENNSDNHDEQHWLIALLHAHKFNPFFELQWELSTFLRHFVYIDSRLSGQNNWTRIIKFQPVGIISLPNGVELKHTTGVRAQYVSSDFNKDQPGSNYAIREVYIQDSLAIPITERISLVSTYRFESEELGSLNWGNFSSRPRTLWQNQWFSMKFRQRLSEQFMFAAGADFYEQKRWQYDLGTGSELSKQLVAVHSNLGPTLQFGYRGNNNTIVIFSAQRQKVFPFSSEAYYINNLRLAVRWIF